jgi:hypothetical protein
MLEWIDLVPGSHDFSDVCYGDHAQFINWNSGSFSSRKQLVSFIYVAGNVTITGEGKEIHVSTVPGYDPEKHGDQTYTTLNFTLELEAGWNAILYREASNGILDGKSANTISISLGKPSLISWVVSESDD